MQADAATIANSTEACRPDKDHFVVLDGLRGVAAVLVVIFHLFETFTDGDPARQIINHGYLAVDFFFLLSGFVIAYAYDDRWERMGMGEFFKRRLVRLQPMIVVGSVLGALLWGFQRYSIYPDLADSTRWQVVAAMLVGFTMVPLPVSLDIRGWGEMYPLDGPAWSLFYEYLANVLYALGLRRLGNRSLGGVVLLAGSALVALLLFGQRGDLIGGWSLDPDHVVIGLTRVMFPFFAGILLMRLGKRIAVGNAFVICSAILIAALSVPRIGGPDSTWMNGLYEAFCVIVVFPLIVMIGAGASGSSIAATRTAAFFGALSYPLYITHYPLIYIYTGWAADNRVSAASGAVAGAGLLAVSIALAWGSLKLVDEPARRWLAARLLRREG